ncbi:hypothetical protein AMECASPLE_010352 [Ameca splendens]|uniref:Uncharacterized protein n=1 Tax=Ameca splendens TaxID=208324 RepID=A0ABV0YZX2_9TELE
MVPDPIQSPNQVHQNQKSENQKIYFSVSVNIIKVNLWSGSAVMGPFRCFHRYNKGFIRWSSSGLLTPWEASRSEPHHSCPLPHCFSFLTRTTDRHDVGIFSPPDQPGQNVSKLTGSAGQGNDSTTASFPFHNKSPEDRFLPSH